MKRLIALLVLSSLLLAACAAPNKNGSGVGNITEPTQTETGETGTTNEDVANGGEEAASHLELSDTFQTLLDEVNAAHEAVTAYTGGYAEYAMQHEEPGFNSNQYDYIFPQMPGNDVVLTLEQVTEDMEICYKALRTRYGCYNYFGGDDAFRPAIDAVIADCAALDVITCGDLRNSLEKHFSFVKDDHVAMGNRYASERQIPFFYREVSYYKTESGYRTLDGKTVSSVDGYEDLDELFKLSMTQEGELVYYPILLQGAAYRNWLTETLESSTVLTVRYSDGSYDELTAEPYRMEYDPQAQSDTFITEEQGIPVMMGNYWQSNGSALLDAAADYQESDLLVADLRKNLGGDTAVVSKWFQNYTGQTVLPNLLMLKRDNPKGLEVCFEPGEDFIDMDKVLIVLTSKMTMSASEFFVDMAYNLENTLIVGENTRGCLRGGGANRYCTLPNSKFYMEFGSTLTLFANDEYFEEYRGFYPDIWVPEAEAKEAVMNFIARNTDASK